MVKDSDFLEKWNNSLTAHQKVNLTYEQALKIFTALWQEAIHLGILPSKNPLEGIETDIHLARILNLCSKNSSKK